MLNLRNASIYMIILAALGFLLMIFNMQYIWLFAALAVIYIYLLVMGSVKICAGFYIKVLCHGGTSKKLVALTFDDGPDPDQTPRILEILEKHQVRATFFVIGRKAEDEEDLLRNIFSAGHTIGNHSYSHALFFDLFGRKKMEQDLLRANNVIEKVSANKPVLFRPPFGVTNPIVAKVVKKLGYHAIGWSVKSLDTVLKNPDKIVERINDRLHPGAVILMHDDREMTVKVLEEVILKIKKEGYRFVGVEEMMGFTPRTR